MWTQYARFVALFIKDKEKRKINIVQIMFYAGIVLYSISKHLAM